MITHSVKDLSRNGPCGADHDLLTVISLNGEKVNRTKYSHLYFPIGLDVFGSSNRTMAQAYIIAMPHEPSTWPKGFEESPDVVDNLYTTATTRQMARLRTTFTKTWRCRKDFVGLWGYFQDKPAYSVSSQFLTYPAINQNRNVTEVRVYVPTRSFENSQVLIQTFQSAFSSWGGAFGVAWGFFYFLFGSPRMDPFGFFALYILGRSTKRILEERYFAENKKKDDSILKDDPSTTTTTAAAKGSTRVHGGSTSALSHDFKDPQDDLEAQQRKDQKYRDLEARIVSLESVLDDFYLDLSPFRKEKEEEKPKKSSSWYRRTFSNKTKDEKDGTFVQIEEDVGRKTSYESESYQENKHSKTMVLSNALYTIGYSSDDFLTDTLGQPGAPASVCARDDLDTIQEWEVILQPGAEDLAFLRNSKTGQFLSISHDDKVILGSNELQRCWFLTATDQPDQYFIKPLQTDEDSTELVLDTLWVEDQLTVALQPKKDLTQTWIVARKSMSD
ncbi:hypothetical protein EC968_005726 [Mortierella alpina]|nr:hypothetical protein EC968_005726 [Mortierella alpina]